MNPSQNTRRSETSNTETAKLRPLSETTLTLPPTPTASKESSSPLKLEKAGNGFKISVDKGTKLDITYEKNLPGGGSARGSINAPSGNTTKVTQSGVTIEKTADGFLVTAEKGITLSAITKNSAGSIVKTPIEIKEDKATKPLANREAHVQEPPKVTSPAPKTEVAQDSRSTSPSPVQTKPLPDITSIINLPPLSSKGNLLNTEQKPQVELKTLLEEAKTLNLPASVATEAHRHNLSDLSKVKIINGEYQHCADSCISLGKVPQNIEKKEGGSTDPKISTEKATAKSATINPETKAEQKTETLDLANLKPGSKLTYSYSVNGLKSSGTIEVPSSSSRTISATHNGVGRLVKNEDGSFRLEKSANFSGTISQGALTETTTGRAAEANQQRNERRTPVRDAVENTLQKTANTLRNVADRRSNVLHLSPANAKEYVRNNPDENIVVILTSPAICPPCRQYDPQVNAAVNQVKNTTFIFANTGNSFSDSNFGISSIPVTIGYSADRGSPLQESMRVSGAQSSGALVGMLNSRLSK